jgi:hypothetical protein
VIGGGDGSRWFVCGSYRECIRTLTDISLALSDYKTASGPGSKAARTTHVSQRRVNRVFFGLARRRVRLPGEREKGKSAQPATQSPHLKTSAPAQCGHRIMSQLCDGQFQSNQ